MRDVGIQLDEVADTLREFVSISYHTTNPILADCTLAHIYL